MPQHFTTIPAPLQPLIQRSLALCKTLLQYRDTFYPFAGIVESERLGCLFLESSQTDSVAASEMIERLQWRIIDSITQSDSWGLLVYSAIVTSDDKRTMNAISLVGTGPEGEEVLVLYPYYRLGQQIVLSSPMIGE